jgi:hypothetical protein
MNWPTHWFRLSSWLWFQKFPVRAVLFNGKTATIIGWRRAWFGPALRLLVDGDERVSDGWDPATIVRVWSEKGA